MTITGLLRGQADDSRPTSVSHRLRARRFERFERFAATLPRPLTVLDLGGTTDYWEQRGWAGRDDVTVTLVNLTAGEQRHENIVPTVGDATRLDDYDDRSFGLVFSNSVIEHVFTWEAQQAMARGVRRIGRAYHVQTPNFWFPVEPHFLTPGWQWLPVGVRTAILQRRGVGWMGRCPDPADAERAVREVRLLRRSEMERLFPGAEIVAERLGGLVKSWTAVAAGPAPRALRPRG